MSMDEAGSGFPLEAEAQKKRGTRSRPAKARKHKETTVYKGKLAEALDALHAQGHEVLTILSSPDIRGYEIVSYTEE